MSSRLARPDLAGSAPDQAARERLRRYAVLGPLLLLLVLWIWLFASEGAFRAGPGGKAFGADFAMFVGAASVMQNGGNPYDHSVLYRTESAMMHRQHLKMTHLKPVVRVGNPPLFLWALEPVTGLPFRPTAWVWMLGLYALSAAGFLACLRYLGWDTWFLPALIFLLMPQVVTGAFYGNPIGLVFAALSASLLLLRRHAALAGALLTIAWLKPPVALPIVLLIFLFHREQRRPIAAGFGGATIGLLVLTLLTTGVSSLGLWVTGLLHYSRDMAIQPDVASLAGLYVRWMPGVARLGTEALVLAAAVALTANWAWRARNQRDLPPLAIAWLWFVWMLATPYAHFFDEILLTVPVLALLGRDGECLTRRAPAITLYLMFVSLLFIQATPAGIYLLPLPLIVVAVFLWRAREGSRPAHA